MSYTAFSELSMLQKQQHMSHYLVPRPIAWIVTQASDGTTNVAPYAHVACVSFDPAMFLVSFVSCADGSLKDTLRYIRDTGVATLCSVGQADTKKMYQSSNEVAGDESQLYDIPCVSSLDGYPPAIASAGSVFLCRSVGEVDIPSKTNINLLLEIEHHKSTNHAAFIDDVVGYYDGPFGIRHAIDVL